MILTIPQEEMGIMEKEANQEPTKICSHCNKKIKVEEGYFNYLSVLYCKACWDELNPAGSTKK